MALRDVTLSDKYTLDEGRIFITGIQALVRLPMLQRDRDLAAGHNTAGYVSGYRGSPLGALDQQMVQARKFLQDKHVQFVPGVNEDLAATAVWGTQQSPMTGECRYDGVFGMWYAKGPGVDRSGDVLRHGNLAGASGLGGVLCLMGDDHACESSTTAHQSEYAMMDAMIPVLNPAGVQDILDYGLYGWALSRFSGNWVGLKSVHDTVEATASISVDKGDELEIVLPDDYVMPDGGLNIRWPDTPQEQEQRLHEYRMDAVRAFWRANRVDKVVFDTPDAWLGIATTGKSYLDTRQALNLLGLDEQGARQHGIRLYKIAMTWPLAVDQAREFARGLQSIIVVEEKRDVIESQLKDILYGSANAPTIVGKHDEHGGVLFQPWLRLGGVQIAIELGKRILAKTPNENLAKRLAMLEERIRTNVERAPAAMIRTPYFCAGCPHNSSTQVPEGSKALSGIGCHFMAQWMDRETARYTQMGGEGASWAGEALFSTREHMFQNIGDGTYFHSGFLAIRAAIASKVNVTFKILYNDAVAMTGGQPMDGDLSPESISHQMYGEGVRRIAVVTDEPDKYPSNTDWAPDVTIHHREDLDEVQRELREIKGTSILIYDQTCASEKRRRRKRGAFPDPDKWAFINDEVCEGCGDCGVKSNCVAIVPQETELGRKRAIDQNVCNKDYSCVNGFCPSFVTVHGGQRKKGKGVENEQSSAAQQWTAPLPEPELPAIDGTYSILLTGVGGQGVVTVGAILGMAAHIAGKGVSILDMLGLAQKGGAVTSHLILAEKQEAITSTHVAAGDASLLLGGDVVTTASDATLLGANKGVTTAVVNTYRMMTGDFTSDRDAQFPLDALQQRISESVGDGRASFVNATRIAGRLLGNSIGANFFLAGYAWQMGYLPLPREAIEKAIEVNGQAVDMNLEAFAWGRRAAVDQAAVEKMAAPKVEVVAPTLQRKPVLDEVVANRAQRLTRYQDSDYAERYTALVARVSAAEQAGGATVSSGLSLAVAENYYKLLAYKDEYEVARLHSDTEFMDKVKEQFEGDFELRFHLAPPLFARKDPVTGHLRKKEYGPWMMKAFGVLASMKRFRGTAFDVFGYTGERRRERALIARYEQDVEQVLQSLSPDRLHAAIGLLQLPQQIRGFGHVKEESMDAADAEREVLLAALASPGPARQAA